MKAAPIPVLAPGQRRVIEAAIERLIALLDELDSDPDLEPENDDEPSQGWPNGFVGCQHGRMGDLEMDASEGPGRP